MCQPYSDSNERMEPTDDKLLGPDNEEQVGSSTSHTVRPEQGTIKQNGSCPYEAPLTTPTISLTSYDSFASNCSDYSVDINPHDGHNSEEGRSENGQDDPRYRLPNGHLSKSNSLVNLENHKEEKNGFVLGNLDLGSTDDDITSSDESFDESDEPSITFDDKDEIWDPPEAENEEDNKEHSMATLDDDDDDECADCGGTEWAKPSSLNDSDEEFSSSYRFKEEKQKAMEEVMNGKFKNLVSLLLKKIGIDNCDKNEESWVDIVTQLAWQAASFVKPEATEGKAMDPAGYVKIKCIPTGRPSESQLIKGLVFKKHAAHKHMATKYKNPKLLLVQGMLGQSSGSSGLSSFNSMITEDKVNLTDLMENLQACHPNVILVEKSASRDVLQKVLEMGVTLVLDMKLHRLERVARCTGSPIMASDIPFNQKLKHCDSLYFEKFVEEHAIVGEGGKKPSKTLMFLEGCPKRLGCTILLKGSHSEELKKIKCVVQCAVVMAYHFILETSFLIDQKAMFSTIAFGRAVDFSSTDEQSKSIVSETSNIPCNGEPNVVGTSAVTVHTPISSGSDELPSHVPKSIVDVPISNGFHKESTHVNETTAEVAISNGFHDKVPHSMQLLVDDPSNMTTLSTSSPLISDELEKVSIVSPATYQNISTYIDLNGREPEAQTTASIPVLPTEEEPDRLDIELQGSSREDSQLDTGSQPLSTFSSAAGDVQKAIEDGEDCIRTKDEISKVLDSESILVLMSTRNASRGTICEQSHFSQIKFYRNFDVPLGKFLQDNLFNQNLTCKACSGRPEAHFYYYAHHNKQLTIRVKRLGDGNHLPGQSERKLWMWSRCGKCEPDKEKATKRVLISTAARGLSFGKFLELSFSSHSSFNRLSSCGHSLQRDFLYFFGMGSMVAMFQYSRVATYTISVPAQKLEFKSSINGEWLQHEIENVTTKGLLLFTEVAKYLKNIEYQFSDSNLVLNGSSKGFNDIVDMLKMERSEFEENIKNIGIKNENSHNSVHKVLRLNRLRWELLLEACVWDRRLQLLLSSSSTSTGTSSFNEPLKRPIDLEKDDSVGEQMVSENTRPLGDEALNRQMDMEKDHNDEIIEGEKVISHDDHDSSENSTDVEVQIERVIGADKLSGEEFPFEGKLQGCGEQDMINLPIIEENIQSPTSEDSVPSVSLVQEPDLSSNGESPEVDNISLSENLLEDRSIPIIGDQEDGSCSAYKGVSERLASPPLLKSEDSKGWVWKPFAKIREECMKDFYKGFLPKFGHLPKLELLHSPNFLPTVSQVILEEGSRLHIPLSDGDYVVSDYDGEISSSIACALALVKDVSLQALDNDENIGLKRAASSPNWSSSTPHDPDVIHSSSSMSFTESRFSSFDGSSLLDSLVSYGKLHPEISLGLDKNSLKAKYSVVCMYANEFRAFRDRCCPSELDYIASLSRCKIWDAKGGKSKSFFAKTLDDRLIIKEIKKTEFESFMKFASDYFSHMKQSFDSGNQTCLAKVLGIYQVTIRNAKSGKETKHDLMVQENLSFGRNITRQYDLKGALHARFTSTADGTGDVLLDQNFVNDMNSSPLYIGQKAKRLLQRAVWNDTTFLNSINVMDYSLLVGVDRQRRELVCGIIDYLRQYTWDKQLETWVKSSLVVPKNVLPTIISPKEYKKRFRKFMDTHFLTVPDHWCSQRSSNPCKLCGIKPEDSSLVKPEKREEELNGSSYGHD